MSGSGIFKNALFALALLSLSAPQAEAIEIFGEVNPAAHMNDDMITQVRGGRGGGVHHRGGAGMHRGGMHHGGMHRPPGAVQRSRPSPRLPAGRWRLSSRPSWLSPRLPSRISPRISPRLSSRLRRLGASDLVSLEPRRRHRGGRGDRLRQRGGGGGLGGRSAWPRPVLVLYRPEPPAGLLGRLPVANVQRRPGFRQAPSREVRL
jgi:hypothetical protein